MDELHPQSFTGLLIPEVPIKPTDYILGDPANPLGDLGLREIVPSGRWNEYKPFGQVQNRPGYFDTSDCTGFGYVRDIATQLNAKWQLGLLSDRFIEWARSKGYIQKEGDRESFMFDPRVLGILAGTTSNGNWLQVVADVARKNGLVPAGTLPGPESCTNTGEYYDATLVTEEIKALGIEFIKYIDLPYNWIVTNVPDTSDDSIIIPALKACPLYVALCTCGGWNSPPVPWCNAGTASNHCVCEISLREILDSYAPFEKPLAANYAIPFKMQVLAIERQGVDEMTIGYKKANNATVYVQVGNNKLVALADWQAFLDIGGSSVSVVTLPDSELAKFQIVPHTLFKSN